MVKWFEGFNNCLSEIKHTLQPSTSLVTINLDFLTKGVFVCGHIAVVAAKYYLMSRSQIFYPIICKQLDIVKHTAASQGRFLNLAMFYYHFELVIEH